MGKALTPARIIIALSAIIAAGHLAGAFLGWYWNPDFFWLDMALHFLGGAFVGSFVWYIGEKSERLNLFYEDFLRNLFVFLGSAALVGIGWEFFEFFYDWFFVYGGRVTSPIFQIAQVSMADTMADLFFDLVGGAAIAVFRFLKVREW